MPYSTITMLTILGILVIILILKMIDSPNEED